MKLSARFLMEFTRGHYGPVQAIAFVPGEFSIRIGARTSDLLIDRQNALKLRHKHKFRYEHLQLIQTAINEGWVTCGRRPGKDILTFVQHWSGAVTCPAC